VTSFDSDLSVENRIAALEQAVSDERQARQWLQEEVMYLTGELELLSGGDNPEPPPEVDVEQPTEDSRSARRENYRRRYSEDGRIEALIEAGFLPGQASLIVRREAELQMDALQARYDAERSGDPVDYFRSRNAGNDALREELGDADYERYLEANNRSTSISISSVIDSSPAQAAGLRSGDEIVRYDGERVFSMTDLTQQAIEGVPGQNVAVDIVRNGVPMQVVMPRGPVGISGGRRRQ
jgi:C-terminal processing protease CtpA/Prc